MPICVNLRCPKCNSEELRPVESNGLVVVSSCDKCGATSSHNTFIEAAIISQSQESQSMSTENIKTMITVAQHAKRDMANRLSNFVETLSGSPGITVQRAMKLKGELVRSLLMTVPLSAEICPYCLTARDCNRCEFGEVHGICGEPDSTFRTLVTKRNDVAKDLYDMYNTSLKDAERAKKKV